MKFTPGPAIAAASGSVGGTVFSRNRYGAYTRYRAIPVTSTTPDAINAKARFSNQSQGWQNLTAAQRLAWNTWALNNPTIDALGQQQVLAGNAAFVGINTLLEQAGETVLTNPPIALPPSPLTSLTQEADIGAGDFELNFTPTPLGATERLVVQAYVSNSPAINFVQNQLRIVTIATAATASPFDHQTVVETKFGALVVGQTVHTQAFVMDTATGLRSLPLRVDTVVVST